MMHFTVALPDMLDQPSKVALVCEINKNISECFDSPSYGAVHSDPGNPHLHASIPMYQVIPTPQGYELGQRINHGLRPEERLAAGLERSRVNELTQIRQRVAHLIADAVHHHFVMLGHEDAKPHHVAERWRWGFEALEVQVQRAAARGDVDFVRDNALREPTRKRGLKNRSDRMEPDMFAADHSGCAPKEPKPTEPSIRLYTQIAVKRVLQLAQKAQIRKPRWLRRFMHEHGIGMDFVGTQDKPARGVVFGFFDGPRFSGSKLGVSIFNLKKLFGWSVNPISSGLIEKAEHPGTQYDEQLRALGIVPKDLFSYAVLYANKWSENLQSIAIQKTSHQIDSVDSQGDTQLSAHPTETEQSKAKMEQDNRPEYGSLYLRKTSNPKFD